MAGKMKRWTVITDFVGGLDIALDTRKVPPNVLGAVLEIHENLEQQRIIVGLAEHEMVKSKRLLREN